MFERETTAQSACYGTAGKTRSGRWTLRIIDLERRIADQKRRAISEGGDMLRAFEVLQVMEQTLENWRAHNLLRHLY